MMDNKTFLIAGILFALVIGVLAVFLASGDPDGLESTALMVSGQKDLTGSAPEDGDPEVIGTGTFSYSAPMPDYSLGETMGTLGGVISIIVGIFLTLVVVIGATWLVRQGNDRTKS
ncbi:PDGLE domain-containing protein [Methanospirillum lacunae]|uniref:Cobalamin biosynthesis protein CbiN n=1 Tax=Methanospirillum lacunae TaxID=668570 RepID=A0A2V2MZX5_9EURY|nr:PDGLE domain-containing protein [Methanospirillum lacunae]PWR73029.1 cobalamin biosynthesis protein CbiN [Methanospirillum lacunae]